MWCCLFNGHDVCWQIDFIRQISKYTCIYIHGILHAYKFPKGSSPSTDFAGHLGPLHPWLLKEVTFSIERLTEEVSPIRWSRWAPDTQQWLRVPNRRYDAEFDDEEGEDAEMIQTLEISSFPSLVKMLHFEFHVCWTGFNQHAYIMSLVSQNKNLKRLGKPELVVRWGLGSLGLSTQVLGFEFSRLVCEMWSVFICYGPQVVSSEMVGLVQGYQHGLVALLIREEGRLVDLVA